MDLNDMMDFTEGYEQYYSIENYSIEDQNDQNELSFFQSSDASPEVVYNDSPFIVEDTHAIYEEYSLQDPLQEDNQLERTKSLDKKNNSTISPGNEIVNLCDSDSESDEDIVDLCGSDQTQSDPVINLHRVEMIEKPKNIMKIFPSHKTKTVGILEYLEGKKESQIVNPNSLNEGYVLCARDLVRLLTPKAWLNDVVIQNYILLLAKTCEKTLIICTDTLKAFQRNKKEAVNNWLENNNLCGCDTILIVINPNADHWVLLVAHPKNDIIYFLDSYNKFYRKDYKLVSKFLTLAYKKTQENLTFTKALTNFCWTPYIIQCPIQENDYDCGVFACTNARYYLLEKELEYSEEDIRLLRQRIAFELINNKIVKDYATPLNYYVN